MRVVINGHAVDFANTPTEADIDEAAQHLGISAPPKLSQFAHGDVTPDPNFNQQLAAKHQNDPDYKAAQLNRVSTLGASLDPEDAQMMAELRGSQSMSPAQQDFIATNRKIKPGQGPSLSQSVNDITNPASEMVRPIIEGVAGAALSATGAGTIANAVNPGIVKGASKAIAGLANPVGLLQFGTKTVSDPVGTVGDVYNQTVSQGKTVLDPNTSVQDRFEAGAGLALTAYMGYHGISGLIKGGKLGLAAVELTKQTGMPLADAYAAVKNAHSLADTGTPYDPGTPPAPYNPGEVTPGEPPIQTFKPRPEVTANEPPAPLQPTRLLGEPDHSFGPESVGVMDQYGHTMVHTPDDLARLNAMIEEFKSEGVKRYYADKQAGSPNGTAPVLSSLPKPFTGDPTLFNDTGTPINGTPETPASPAPPAPLTESEYFAQANLEAQTKAAAVEAERVKAFNAPYVPGAFDAPTPETTPAPEGNPNATAPLGVPNEATYNGTPTTATPEPGTPNPEPVAPAPQAPATPEPGTPQVDTSQPDATTPKEPWQMTRLDARGGRGIAMGDNAPHQLDQFRSWDAEHKAAVEQALSEGKPVPPEVLKDYPDLTQKYPQTATPGTGVDYARTPDATTPFVPTVSDPTTPISQNQAFDQAHGGPAVVEQIKQEGSESPLQPGPNAFQRTIAAMGRAVVLGLSPESGLGDQSRAPLIANIVRGVMGETKMRTAQAAYKMRDANRLITKLGEQGQLDFYDKYEKGEMQNTPQLEAAAQTISEVQDSNLALLQQSGMLKEGIDNYLPHLFKDVDSARKVIGEYTARTLTPGKPFLIQRNHALLSDAIEAAKAKGLELVTSNPVKAMQLRTNAIQDAVQMRNLVERLKGMDDFQYVRAGGQAPDDLVKIPALKMMKPNEAVIKETYDAGMREAQYKLADSLGINHERVAHIEGGALGASYKGQGRIQTRFDSPDSVLTHEIAHAIDDKFGMQQRMFGGADGKIVRNEMDLLAQQRYAGETPSESYQKYARNPSEMFANLVTAYIHAPEMAADIAPTATMKLNKLIDANPSLHALRDITPSMKLATDNHTVQLPGFFRTGDYYAKPDVASVLNSFNAPGLKGNFIYDTLSRANRLYNQLNLSLSAFHGVTTMKNGALIQQEAAMQELISRGMQPDRGGAVGRGLMSYPKSAGDTLNLFRGGRESNQVIHDYLAGISDPKTAHVIEGLRASNMNVLPDSVYVDNYKQKFADAIANHDWKDAGMKAIPTLLETLNAPIMEHQVPAAKVAAFQTLLETEMRRTGYLPGTPEFNQIAITAADHVENVMGQMNHDNLFMKQWVKDMAQMTTRSTGWTGGTIRAGVTGVKDLGTLRDGLLTYRTARLPLLLIGTAVNGAILQRILTGKNPQDLKDYFYPKTGRLNADGTDERISPPGEFNDYANYGHDLYRAGNEMDPRRLLDTLGNKESPIVGLLSSIIMNHDYNGVEIAHPDDNPGNKALSMGEFAAKQAMPFTLANFLKGDQEGKGMNPLSFAGVKNAPGWATKSAALEKASEYNHVNSEGSRTQSEANASINRSIVMGMVRNHEMDNARTFFTNKKMTPHDEALITSRLNSPALVDKAKSLKADQLAHVFSLASPEEKEMLWPHVQRKITSTGQDDPELAKQLMQSVQTAVAH